jgi:hypothetical protein
VFCTERSSIQNTTDGCFGYKKGCLKKRFACYHTKTLLQALYLVYVWLYIWLYVWLMAKSNREYIIFGFAVLDVIWDSLFQHIWVHDKYCFMKLIDCSQSLAWKNNDKRANKLLSKYIQQFQFYGFRNHW